VPDSPVPHDAHVRRASKLLFGNADRLPVAAEIARPGRTVVSASELAKELQIAPNRVWQQLRTFAEVGLLQELPRIGSTVDYLRCESPFWPLAHALLRDLAQDAAH
jgi:DNA-binding transcriptional regulator YhcF (GntR family)